MAESGTSDLRPDQPRIALWYRDRRWLIAAAVGVVAVLLFIGWRFIDFKKKGGGGASAMSKMSEFKDQMCKCKDSACAQAVADTMTKWSQEQAKASSSPPKMSEEEMKKATAIGEEMGLCMQKAMGGGGGAGSGNELPLATCPPGDIPLPPTVGRPSFEPSNDIRIDPGSPTIYSAEPNLSRNTYVIIYGQRPLQPGQADPTYDKLKCIDARNAFKMATLDLRIANTGQLYRGLRYRAWLDNRPQLTVQIERDEDTHDGARPSYKTLILNRGSSTTLDTLIRVTLETPPQTARDAGIDARSDGGQP